MATDAAINLGLTVGKLSELTRARLRELLPPEASVDNPVDMTPKMGPSQYAACARIMLEDQSIDSLLVIFVPPLMINPFDVVSGVEKLRREFTKPILGVIMATESFFDELNAKQPGHMAIYHFPEPAVQALAALDRYRQWRERPVGKVHLFPADRIGAQQLLDAAREEGKEHLAAADGLRLLECYGIPIARYCTAPSLGALEDCAEKLPFPVVLKAIVPGLVHKTEAGGVVTDLRTPEELFAAARRIRSALERPRAGNEPGLSFLVQEYVRGGREVIVGMVQDPSFGPLIMFGLGGVYVETLKDVTFRIPPLTDLDAQEMVRQIRGYKLLEGVRGEQSVDFDALTQVLQRFSQLVEDLPEVADFEINPLMIFPDARDFRAVDARVRLARIHDD
jgi:acetyltransferase